MRPFMRRGVFCLILGLFATPAQAIDPMLMFLLSAAREIMAAAARAEKKAPAAPTPSAPAPATRYPGTTVEPRELQRLIDESFTYLTPQQRSEIFESLHRHLMDPKNAAQSTSTIGYFTARAASVREAQQRLATLSEADRERLLAEFKLALADMSPEETAQLAAMLRQGVLPVPGDLSDQLLAAIGAR